MEVICINDYGNTWLRKGYKYRVINLFIDKISIIREPSMVGVVFPLVRFTTLDGVSLTEYVKGFHVYDTIKYTTPLLYNDPKILNFKEIKEGQYLHSYRSNKKKF